MADDPFAQKAPRADHTETFAAALVEPLGPALIGDGRTATAALVAAYLLQQAARAGGTRVKTSSVESAIALLERAITPDARRLCEDEARRIARWCVREAAEEEEELVGDLAVMASADQRSRIAVIQWAIDEELDVELEWFDPEEERWPRRRAQPIRVDEVDGEVLVFVQTSLAEIAIPVANLRWVMPVERHEQPSPELARVLQFPGAREEE